MKKWNLIVDVARCNNCYNCFIGTKDEYVGNRYEGVSAPQPLHGQSWVKMEYRESGQWPMVDTWFRPVMCNHCDDAPCMKVAKNGAIRKRDDGIVIIDPERAKGQKEIVDACPYGAVYWNEEAQLPQAWPFDAHLLDSGWDRTKLETVCPTEVFESVKLTDDDMRARAEAEGLETLPSESGARPRVYYRNNHLFTTCFVGGTVVTVEDGVEDCLADANVTLMKDDSELGSAPSDAFGEFRIAGLQLHLGEVQLLVEVDGQPVHRQELQLEDSLYVGCIEV